LKSLLLGDMNKIKETSLSRIESEESFDSEKEDEESV